MRSSKELSTGAYHLKSCSNSTENHWWKAPERSRSPPTRNSFAFAPSVVSHKSLYFDCHSERSEESRLFKYMRPFTSFRVTRKKPFSASCQCKETLDSPH